MKNLILISVLCGLAGCATQRSTPLDKTIREAAPAARLFSMDPPPACEPAADFIVGNGAVLIGGRPILGIKCQTIETTTDTITSQYASVALGHDLEEGIVLASNPVIEPGLEDNQLLLITGVAGADYYTVIPNGAGTALQADGRAISGPNSMLLLVWRNNTWVEVAYRSDGPVILAKRFESQEMSTQTIDVFQGLNLYPRTSVNLSTDTLALAATAPQVPVNSLGGSWTIRGIVANGAPRIIFVANVGALDFTLAEEDGSATASNRIVTGTGPVTIQPGATRLLIYDSANFRWRVVG